MRYSPGNMISRINRLVSAILIIAASLYVVILNREPVTIRLAPSYEITTSAGVIFIALFCLGIVCAALVAAFFGFRAYLRERQLRYRERLREAFYLNMLQARSALASGELGRAKDLWQQIIRREPSNVVARVELSKTLERSGEHLEALKVLDAARIEAPENAEVLLRAAEAHIALGNKTAAIDNLALATYHQPSAKAAMMARDLSEDLGRIEDALEYHAQAYKLSPSDPSHPGALARLRLRKLVKEHGQEPVALLRELRTFAKKHTDDANAWEMLAEHELAAGKTEEAAQAFVRAARLTKRLDLWYRATEIWVKEHNPDRALAAARAVSKDSQGIARIEAELALTRTLISLGMFDEGVQGLDRIPVLALEQDCTLPQDLSVEISLLKSICLSSLGKTREATTELLQVVNGPARLSTAPHEPRNGRMGVLLSDSKSVGSKAPGAPPPPRLSTP